MTFNWWALVSLVLGAVIVHFLAVFREQKAKKREITIGYLVDSIRFFACEVIQKEIDEKTTIKLENTLTDIQIFGSREQAELAMVIMDEISRGEKKTSLDKLMNDLRSSLRKELSLEKIPGNIKWLRHSSRSK